MINTKFKNIGEFLGNAINVQEIFAKRKHAIDLL